MNKTNKMNIMKKHPVSTVLLLLYVVMFIVQRGNLEVFIAGFLAASAAYILESLYVATGTIRTGAPRDST